jgi:hypothetical protein
VHKAYADTVIALRERNQRGMGVCNEIDHIRLDASNCGWMFFKL